MIADLKPYAEYKESGLPWLGQMPGHWENRPLRTIARLAGRRGTTSSDTSEADTGVLSVTPSELDGRTRASHTRTYLSAKAIPFFEVVPAGATAICTIASVGQSARFVRPFVTNPQVRALVPFPHAVESEFLFLLCLTLKQPIRALATTSVVPFVNGSDVIGLRIALPPPDDQAAIVRFLDWANGRLERAIRAKRKVIALLNEQKQAIIHRGVTRGLDPSVPLKPSGLPWLGDIPQHWELRRLSSVAHFQSGKAHERFVDAAGESICVTARFVSTGGKARKYCTKNLCPAAKHDVLMVMSDLPSGRALARSYLVRDDNLYAVNQRVCLLRAHAIDPRLLAYWSNRNWHLLRNDDGLNQTHLSNYDFKTMPVLLPPTVEQGPIADWLDFATADIESASGRLARECELLQEYRTRLVADVVTGKLDVRDAAARLPDEAPLDSVDADADLSDETETADEEAAV